MEVPPEVLITAMRTHQKYFALLDRETAAWRRASRSSPMSRRADGGKAIVAGNERVLRARLSDARFFWDQDRKQRLESRVPALNDIMFHAKLGTVGDKVDRIESLAVEIATHIPNANKDRVRSAARLAKADLTTGMVGEFPELQGVMGRYYALHDKEHASVAEAIAEHYTPLGPSDACPTAATSVAVALADKLDTLVGFWLIGEKPTGSKDPFALRRAALGVIRLVLENGLRVGTGAPFRRSDAALPRGAAGAAARRRSRRGRAQRLARPAGVLRRPAQGASARGGRAPRSDRRRCSRSAARTTSCASWPASTRSRTFSAPTTAPTS